ncbi:2TM domain-containing protein [Chitinophaga skermanii]|uniref:2TM domain-containing protein n=1 Tax=Chitinophaga skermanii TaxID=331697 RepID=A0A327R471_9BACT|nr:2TM domain-containing protein [Chitinophaga skermanii]
MEMNELRDMKLARLAKAKASFMSHLMAYICINSTLWAIWYLALKNYNGLPWPVWFTFSWGIGLLFGYCNAYRRYSVVDINSSEGEEAQ